MELIRSISVPKAPRVAAIGLDVEFYYEALGRNAEPPVGVEIISGTLHEWLGNDPSGVYDVILFDARDSVHAVPVIDGLRARLAERGVVAIRIDETLRGRFLAHHSNRNLLIALGGLGFSLVSPPKLLSSIAPDTAIIARRDPFVIRAFRQGDETRILDLFATSFGHERTEAHWRWEYERNPDGGPCIAEAFGPEDELVSHYAGYPVGLWSSDPRVSPPLAMQVGDTMTARAVRSHGRGITSLVVRTARHFWALFCEGKVAFNYGFNTRNIHRMSERYIESEPVEPVPFWSGLASEIPGRSFLERLARIGRGYRIEVIEHLDEDEFDRFFERVAPSYGTLVRRDSRHLWWRYLSSPVWRYILLSLRFRGALVGWSAFRVIDGRLMWGDALYDPAHTHGALDVLKEATRLTKVESVQAWFPERPGWWHQTLVDSPLGRTTEPSDLQFICTPFSLGNAAAFLRERFYYSAFDSDLY